MVNKDPHLYLFLGEDSPAKDLKLKTIKQEFLNPGLEQFNLDILYARELGLKNLQEKMLSLPIKAKKRIIVIKDAQALKEGLKSFILSFAKNPIAPIILILDFFHYDTGDEFISALKPYSCVLHFREKIKPDTFLLGRMITLKKPGYSLNVLAQLLENGSSPEWILGGLRYIIQKDTANRLDRRNRLRAILNCDADIKKGRLKPAFALERLVINLCGPGKHSG